MRIWEQRLRQVESEKATRPQGREGRDLENGANQVFGREMKPLGENLGDRQGEIVENGEKQQVLMRLEAIIK